MKPLQHTLLFALLLGLSTPTIAAQTRPLRVMSFNIRYPNNDDGENQWGLRRTCVAQLIAREAPDVIGLQEAYRIQAQAIVTDRPEYAWFGRGRRGGTGDEHMAVLYRRDRLRVVREGDFWLSATPQIAGSITWGHPLPRMVTWAEFERIPGGEHFMFYNTHFPYRDEDDAAREQGAMLIARTIAALPAQMPVVLTGDFNTAPESAAHAVLLRTPLSDTRTDGATRSGPDGTWQDFKGLPERRIDWVLQRGFTALKSTTIDTPCAPGRYPSDHFPVLVELENQ